MGIAPYLFVPTKFVLHSILEAIKNMKKLHFTCVSVMTMLNFTQLDLIMNGARSCAALEELSYSAI